MIVVFKLKIIKCIVFGIVFFRVKVLFFEMFYEESILWLNVFFLEYEWVYEYINGF